MIVVADTSPLHYLILIGEVDLLPKPFETVLIPREVIEELTHRKTPSQVRQWAISLPPWLLICTVDQAVSEPLPDLDPGEEAAIRLAQQHTDGALLLMDDLKGRRVAMKLGLKSTGTLGVLRAASQSHLLALREVLPKLIQTNFYVAPNLVAALIEEERRESA